jgi:hypothetical protein
MKTKLYKVLRWVLRGFSGLIIGFSLFFFIGETFFEEAGDPMTINVILQLSIAGMGLAGLGLAWKWELMGGIISLVSFGVLAIINPVVLKFPLLFVWPLLAILFLVLGAISRNSAVKITG